MLAAVALGSNLPSSFGDPAANLHEALARLQSVGIVEAVSPFYRTAPVGSIAQPDFMNAAALITTDLLPGTLLQRLLTIELEMGRSRPDNTPPKGPRIIDLDLLFFQDDAGHNLVLSQPGLILPHPEMAQREFVLRPLADIAPHLVHPVLRQSVLDMLHCLAN